MLAFLLAISMSFGASNEDYDRCEKSAVDSAKHTCKYAPYEGCFGEQYLEEYFECVKKLEK